MSHNSHSVHDHGVDSVEVFKTPDDNRKVVRNEEEEYDVV